MNTLYFKAEEFQKYDDFSEFDKDLDYPQSIIISTLLTNEFINIFNSDIQLTSRKGNLAVFKRDDYNSKQWRRIVFRCIATTASDWWTTKTENLDKYVANPRDLVSIRQQRMIFPDLPVKKYFHAPFPAYTYGEFSLPITGNKSMISFFSIDFIVNYYLSTLSKDEALDKFKSSLDFAYNEKMNEIRKALMIKIDD
jgi:hypothetical protein